MSLHGGIGDKQDALCEWYEIKDSLVYNSHHHQIEGSFEVPWFAWVFITISKFITCVFIWDSMKRSTVEELIDYLFHGLLLSFEIFRQINYRMIETPWSKYLKVIGGSKEIFLKNLSETLFIESAQINREYTIIIDDNLTKCVCNDNGNCLFL